MTNRTASRRSGGDRPEASGLDVSLTNTGEIDQLSFPLCLDPYAMSGTLPTARLFIASLGNPAPYLETRHSAGHVLIKSIAHALSCPPFSRNRGYAKGLTTSPFTQPGWLLWQSPSLMNVSGQPLRDALLTFIKAGSSAHDRVGLVILHDELESAPGMIRERSKTTSHQGHNGLKSVAQSLRGARLLDQLSMIKIGIGIGRPDSRGGADVSSYVLKKMTWEEKQQIEDGAGQAIQLIERFAEKLSK